MRGPNRQMCTSTQHVAEKGAWQPKVWQTPSSPTSSQKNSSRTSCSTPSSKPGDRPDSISGMILISCFKAHLHCCDQHELQHCRPRAGRRKSRDLTPTLPTARRLAKSQTRQHSSVTRDRRRSVVVFSAMMCAFWSALAWSLHLCTLRLSGCGVTSQATCPESPR